jgi:hypothetical protein
METKTEFKEPKYLCGFPIKIALFIIRLLVGINDRKTPKRASLDLFGVLLSWRISIFIKSHAYSGDLRIFVVLLIISCQTFIWGDKITK